MVRDMPYGSQWRRAFLRKFRPSSRCGHWQHSRWHSNWRQRKCCLEAWNEVLLHQLFVVQQSGISHEFPRHIPKMGMKMGIDMHRPHVTQVCRAVWRSGFAPQGSNLWPISTRTWRMLTRILPPQVTLGQLGTVEGRATKVAILQSWDEAVFFLPLSIDLLSWESQHVKSHCQPSTRYHPKCTFKFITVWSSCIVVLCSVLWTCSVSISSIFTFLFFVQPWLPTSCIGSTIAACCAAELLMKVSDNIVGTEKSQVSLGAPWTYHGHTVKICSPNR